METDGTTAVSTTATGWRSPRRVLGVILALSLLLMLLGAAYAWHHRHHTICRDRRAPVAQLDLGLGQIEFRCHDGQIVTQP